MSSIKLTMQPQADVSEETLDESVLRLMAFLSPLNTASQLTLLLGMRGWSSERLQEGYALISELHAVVPAVRRAPRAASAPRAVDAVALGKDLAACEAFQVDDLPCARAFLVATHPEQADFLFHDYVPGKGAAAIVNVQTFLDRYRALEKGPERKATRKADHDAIALITLSGTTKDKLKALAKSVARLQSTSAPALLTPQEMEDNRVIRERRLVVLRKIHAFVTLWSTVARKALSRRDHLVMLGIAKRHARKKHAAKPPVAPAPSPAPVAAPSTPAIPAVSSLEEEQAPSSRAA